MQTVRDEAGSEKALAAATPRPHPAEGGGAAGWLEAMTRLTVSIEHEMNQPLTAILTNAQVALRWLAADPPDVEAARRAIEHAIGNSRRAADVVRSIRSLALHDRAARAEIDLNELVRNLLGLLQLELQRHCVQAEIELADDLQPAWGDHRQLEQVVANLVTNGIQAMTPLRDRPRRLRVSTRRHGSGAILVAVADVGTGIEEQDGARIFDPFFTTKQGGTGLGLTVCRSIVEAHGGRLWAEPNRPQGSILSFTVPTSAGGVDAGR